MIPITESDVRASLAWASEKVGYKHPPASVAIDGKQVTIAFEGCKTTSTRTISGPHDIDNLARMAIIRAIHHEENA